MSNDMIIMQAGDKSKPPRNLSYMYEREEQRNEETGSQCITYRCNDSRHACRLRIQLIFVSWYIISGFQCGSCQHGSFQLSIERRFIGSQQLRSSFQQHIGSQHSRCFRTDSRYRNAYQVSREMEP